jgi:hypothetical protein
MMLYERGSVFFPLYLIMMLGLESGTVIGLRMLKLTCGGSDALNEIHLIGQPLSRESFLFWVPTPFRSWRQHV